MGEMRAVEETELLSVDEARALYASRDAAHDFDHVERVASLAVRIAEAEGADATVVRLAALLHDAPAPDEEDGAAAERMRQEHHLAAAQVARTLLTARGLGTDRVAHVVHCIEAHRYRDRTIQPQTLEAKCLFDADKLDSMGAIGIGRAFAYAGAHRNRLWTMPVAEIPELKDAPEGAGYTPVHEYLYKLNRLLDALHTETARRIGRQRHKIMAHFFAQLDAEMAGLA